MTTDETGRLPEFLKPYFGEVDFNRLRLPGREVYVIERLLEYGDLPAVRWMERKFSRQQIAQVVRHSRALSLRSANFWAKMLNISQEKVRCLSEPFRKERRAIWQR